MSKKLVHFSIIEFVFLLLFCISTLAIKDRFLQISLWVILPSVFVYTMIRHWRHFFVNKSIKLYLFLVLWLAFASLFAYDTEVAFREMVKILSSFLCSVAGYHFAKNKNNTLVLYIAMVGCFISLLYYAFGNMEFLIATNYQERLQDDFVNANMFAYYLFYASFAVYFLLKRYKLLEIPLLLALLALSFWIALMTASRQVLLLQIPLLICLYSVGKVKDPIKAGLSFVIILIVIIGVGYPLFEQYYSGSYLKQRAAIGYAEDSRFSIMLLAFKYGLDSPIVGFGPGNFVLINGRGIYSHNCFSELFVSGGIIPLVLYLTMLLGNLKQQWKRYKKTNDQFFLYHFIFQAFFIIDNLLYVQISALWLMGFYFISVGHGDSKYCEYQSNTNQLVYAN